MSRVNFFALPLICFLLHGLAALAKIAIENPPFVFGNSGEDKLKRAFLNVDTPWDNDDVLSKPPYSLYVTLENFPNPFIHPSLCNRNGLNYSYVCDPNKILSRSTADKLEEILSYQRRNSSHHCADRGEVPYVLGVALIERLPYGVSAETFSSQILEHWKLGNRNCNDGILLLFVKDDATFVLKWRKGAQSIINFRTATAMNKSFNMYIRRYSLEYSILRAVTLTSQYLTEEIIPPTQTAQIVVALTIGIVVGLGYLACILIVFSDAQKGNI
ncbi:conserved Plasmodium protein, unknown function [Plasmodium vivax]|uniref:MOLO1 domain-containing protein n=4 Tax=Plasmodium vivax TaxID=5855 RepID=A0A0J9TGF6_PLAVI|nr:hypothetical protein PVBG_05645 [Plasmodium vivax Brazil I]KMZ94625.1 hypothetical protein PVMG_01981 [Plasmodium vivax Mauritania I]KNA01022.1 hypothetical protein PVNG_05651 [Plasmodium vivax North Korean]CAG9479955.1 unnamed protein product [Plasmodium vivax]CAI7718966.1 MOLO1 domain-containing protein, putative [Plasmodium vivax]